MKNRKFIINSPETTRYNLGVMLEEIRNDSKELSIDLLKLLSCASVAEEHDLNPLSAEEIVNLSSQLSNFFESLEGVTIEEL